MTNGITTVVEPLPVFITAGNAVESKRAEHDLIWATAATCWTSSWLCNGCVAVTIESAQHIIDDDDNDVALKNYSDESGQRRVHATLIDKDSSQRLPGASSRSLPLTSKQSISNNELVTHADLFSANPSSEGAEQFRLSVGRKFYAKMTNRLV